MEGAMVAMIGKCAKLKGMSGEGGRVDAADAERALGVLIKVGSTVKRGRPITGREETQFVRLLRKTLSPARLGRELSLSPEAIASLCIRVIRARH